MLKTFSKCPILSPNFSPYYLESGSGLPPSHALYICEKWDQDFMIEKFFMEVLIENYFFDSINFPLIYFLCDNDSLGSSSGNWTRLCFFRSC